MPDSLIVVVTDADVSLKRIKQDGSRGRGESLGALTVAVPMEREPPARIYQFPAQKDFFSYRCKVWRGALPKTTPYRVDRYNINIGYSRAEREEFWRMFKAGRLRGRLVEIHYQGFDERGRLRFPIFIRMMPRRTTKI